MPFDEFIERYRILVSDVDLGYGRIAVQRFCDAIDLDPTCIQVGKTKVYCKIGVISEVCLFLNDAKLETFISKFSTFN